VSALVAAATLKIDVAPVYRQWGWIAVGPYAIATVIAAVLALRRRSPTVRARVGLAVAVFVGATLVPLSMEIAWRDRGPRPDSHSNSEPIITEEAARALVHGRNPYATAFLEGPLAAWPIGTKTHYPYLPAMLLFGLPRAAADSVATDARAAFLAGTLALLAVSLRRWKATDQHRLLVCQVLVVLPTGALLLSGGGDDLPVVAMMLLSLVLLDEGLTGWAAATAGAAAAMKQLAWPFVPLLVSTAWKDRGRGQGMRASITAAAVVAGIVAPFVLWNPGAFFDDVVRFPLGYGKPKTFHPTPTPGVLFVRAFPGARGAMAALVAILLLGLLGYVTVRRRPARPGGPSPGADVARDTALVLLVAILLAPSSRIGFFIYPINLLVWARSMAGVPRRTLVASGEERPAGRPA
jgi:hypothetical protein